MSKGREKSPEITLRHMSTNKPNSHTSQNNPRTILQDRESTVFQTLYAEKCSPRYSKNRRKIKLTLNSSLPPEPGRTTTEHKTRCTSSTNRKVIVDYSDDDDENPISSPGKSKNKFAVKEYECASINLLETNRPTSQRRSPRKNEGIKTTNFYNNPPSPQPAPFKKKTYSRILPNANGRVQKPLPIVKVKTKPSPKHDSDTPRKRYPPYNSSPGLDEFKRKGIHVGLNQVYHPMQTKYRRQQKEMETIDLLGCEEISTPSKSETRSKENSHSKHSSRRNTASLESSSSNEAELDPEFSLIYDDDDDLPYLSTVEDEQMDYTQEDEGILKMEIKQIFFGNLRCKPLDKLEVTPDYFRLHIQPTSENAQSQRLLIINRENIENIEVNTLVSSGFIVITPKLEYYDQLSKDLSLTPTIYLNKGDSQYFKTIIVINFDNKVYSINYIYNKLEEWFQRYIPVKIDEQNNLKFLKHDYDERYNDFSPLKENADVKGDIILSSLNSPTVSQNITVSSTESPLIEDGSVLPEVEHSYPAKGNRSLTEPAIEEFYKLVESEQTKLLTFPEAGYPGRITIPKDTIRCLEPEMFLNDTIIEFYLHYILHRIMEPRQREEVHIFNTFFYTKLTNNLGIHLTIENNKTQHALVSKWTKNVDLFEKNFILVPIHDHAHWFLAIICYPSMAGKDPVYSVEEDSDLDSVDFENTRQHYRKRKSRIEKKACVLIFDSLEIHRNTVISNLRLYLQAEWDARHPTDASFKCTTAQMFGGHHPRLPIQPNSWDCGLFLMQYAESFLTHPINDFNTPLKLENWFSLDEIKHKRNRVIKLIFDLSLEEKYSVRRV